MRTDSALKFGLFLLLYLGVAQAIIRSVIDFKRDPWPRVLDNANDLIKKMLNPYTRGIVKTINVNKMVKVGCKI
ncbi:hypothetical protein GUJ93_ZPchr0013g35093 [Zizania palustris]|uniref:Uncharacterized protein n=1 Tax=Zizania palustris TaxID=103762 RepID=A0A8J5X560_ZIZPA|nr:hypothetical protein GUJ93_ZPchr0013g35093 [Zizania palustris]